MFFFSFGYLDSSFVVVDAAHKLERGVDSNNHKEISKPFLILVLILGCCLFNSTLWRLRHTSPHVVAARQWLAGMRKGVFDYNLSLFKGPTPILSNMSMDCSQG
jgi:hypothetical protein